MAFDTQLNGLEASMHGLYQELERLSPSVNKVSDAMHANMRSIMAETGAANDLAKSYERMKVASLRIVDATIRNRRVSKEMTAEYVSQSKCVKELTRQYELMVIVEKKLEFATKSNFDKFHIMTTQVGKMAGGMVGLTGKLGGLTLAHSHLTEKLLEYNRTVFDSMRIGERYGDSLSDHAKALEIVSKRTAMSKQDFEELNLSVKQMSVGIPMTSKAVAELSAQLSGKFGWAADKVKKAVTDMMSVQNKLPDLFERITKVTNDFSQSADKGASSAKALRDQMMAMGSSQSDIETVMSAISGAKPDLQSWMGFEKTMATSKRDIQDSTLMIAGKMQGGLEKIAAVQAGIAKTIASWHRYILLGIGGFSMFGVEAGLFLVKAKMISAEMRMWGSITRSQKFGPRYVDSQSGQGGYGGYGGSGRSGPEGMSSASMGGSGADEIRRIAAIKSAGGIVSGPDFRTGGTNAPSGLFRRTGQTGGVYPQSGVSGSFGRGMGGMSGLGIGLSMAVGMGAPMAANAVENWWTKDYQSKSANDTTLARRKALTRGLGGAASGAATGAAIGSFVPVIGTAIGAVGGAVIGGGMQAYKGWKEGKAGAKDQANAKAEIEAEKIARMGAAAKSAGISVDESSMERILDGIVQEGDHKKKLIALQEMYAGGLLKQSQVQDVLVRSGKKEQEVKNDIKDIITKTWSGSNKILETQMKIERSAGGQLALLTTQLEIINQIRETGSSALDSFQTGDIGMTLADTLGKAGARASKQIADNLQQALALAYIQADSSSKSVRDALGDKNILTFDQMKKAKEQLERLSAEKAPIMEEQQRSLATAPEDKRAGIIEKYRKQLAPIDKEIEDINSNIDKMVGSVNWAGLIPSHKIEENIKGWNDELSRLDEERKKGAKEFADPNNQGKNIAIGEAEVALNNKIRLTHEALLKVRMAESKARDASMANATKHETLKISLLNQQIDLGEKQLAQAEKMGLPQSYTALKNQVGLTYQLYEATKKRQKIENEEMSTWKARGVDVDAVQEKRMTVDEAFSKFQAQAGEDANAAQATFIKQLERRMKTSGEVLDIETKMAEMTKTWREGWMDAMEETIIGAGDFAAVIGLGDRNVPEVLASGGPASFRHGAVNTERLREDQLSQLRYQQASRFTDVHGRLNNNEIQKPSPLMVHSPVLQGFGNPQMGIELARQGKVLAETGQSQAAEAYASEQEAAMMGRSRGSTLNTGTPVDMKTGTYSDASVKPFETGQPGGSPVGRKDIIMEDVSKRFGEGVDKFDRAVDLLSGKLEVTAGGRKAEGKSGGGLVRRMASGGQVGRQPVVVNGQLRNLTYEEYEMGLRRMSMNPKHHNTNMGTLFRKTREARKVHNELFHSPQESEAYYSLSAAQDVQIRKWYDEGVKVAAKTRSELNKGNARRHAELIAWYEDKGIIPSSKKSKATETTHTGKPASHEDEEAALFARQRAMARKMDAVQGSISAGAMKGSRIGLSGGSGMGWMSNRLEDRGMSNRLESRGMSNRLEDRGMSNRLESRGMSNRLESRGMSNRLESRGFSGGLARGGRRGGRGVRRMADGGDIAPGSYVVKQSAASGNADILNSIGADWVTGGIPGQDSVLFGVGMANGGSASIGGVMLMPGEAVVPPQYAAVGESINKGISRFAGGGALPDESAMRDILMSSTGGHGGGGGSASAGGEGGRVTIELSRDASELFRIQGKNDYSNGSTP